ncbi:hypothetical protein JTE90_010614 [Oedothorax gibbosus]|uniref:Uncharacterized protein n=1 Tax=Oedothorax gibbosus TaxID=931172 RepID=A0AAV6TF94_9ARAC|nr:hypothetical protein JTE90_010614 [Oedothorax gibbosus]
MVCVSATSRSERISPTPLGPTDPVNFFTGKTLSSFSPKVSLEFFFSLLPPRLPPVAAPGGHARHLQRTPPRPSPLRVNPHGGKLCRSGPV